ncbi:hypothetical protein IAT38_007502 [Cryptococcus sp. DSM 104549]
MHRDNPYFLKKPDFNDLAAKYADFAPFITVSDSGYASIDFQDPYALRALTKCLFKEDWKLDVDLREDRICPTLSNRLDYTLELLDLEPYLGSSQLGRPLRALDIGTGATAVYPILLHRLRPTAVIAATELDEVSFDHALSTLNRNEIPSSSISIFKAPGPTPILFPLLPNDGEPSSEDREWDFTMCNPPFYGSAQEMQESVDLKEKGAHAAPTAANNELITQGGEVAFVFTMITESVKIGQRCRWFTSLIGKYSSLRPLVDLLGELKITNYFVKSIKQARTSRWIIGWSHTYTRLPERITHPDTIIPHTSFASMLPPSNTFTHKPQPPIPLSTLRESLLALLRDISLDPTKESEPAEYGVDGDGKEDKDDITISPRSITWSRAARRQAARGELAIIDLSSPPLLRARLTLLPSPPPESGESTPGEELVSGWVQLDWLEGKDWNEVDALWKFILSKAGLVGKRTDHAGTEDGAVGEGESWSFRGRGRGRGRGGRGRGGRGGGEKVMTPWKRGVRDAGWGDKATGEQGGENQATDGNPHGEQRRRLD